MDLLLREADLRSEGNLNELLRLLFPIFSFLRRKCWFLCLVRELLLGQISMFVHLFIVGDKKQNIQCVESVSLIGSKTPCLVPWTYL